MRKDQNTNNNSENLVGEFLGDVLFDKDVTNLKKLLLELDEKDRESLVNYINEFVNNMKEKFGDLVPQEIFDLEKRVDTVLTEIGYSSKTGDTNTGSNKPKINSSNKTKMSKNKKTKNKKFLIWIISLFICIAVFFLSVPVFQFFTAPKTAENAIAVCLQKEYNIYEEDRYKFMSFEDVYYTIKLNGFKYTLEMSGSANIANDKVTDFYAKVSISLFSNEVNIKELNIRGSNIR